MRQDELTTLAQQSADNKVENPKNNNMLTQLDGQN
jgi:hypothetical protein